MIQELLDLEERYSTKFAQMKRVQEMFNSQLLSIEEQLSVIENQSSSEMQSMTDVEQLLNEYRNKFNAKLQAMSDQTSREITANARQIDLVIGDQDNDRNARQFKELKKSMKQNKKLSQERFVSLSKQLLDLNSNLRIVNQNTLAYALNAFASDCYSYLYQVYKYIIDIEYQLFFNSLKDEQNWRDFIEEMGNIVQHVKYWVEFAVYPAMKIQFNSFIHWFQLLTIHVSNGYQALHHHVRFFHSFAFYFIFFCDLEILQTIYWIFYTRIKKSKC